MTLVFFLCLFVCLSSHPGVTETRSWFQRKITVDLDVIKVYHTLRHVFQFIITKPGGHPTSWLSVCASLLWPLSQMNLISTKVLLLASRRPVEGPLQSRAAPCSIQGCAHSPSSAQCLWWEDFNIPPSSAPTEMDLMRAIKWKSKLSHGFARVALSQRGKGVVVFPVFSQPK